MIPVPSGVKVWIATGVTDMRRGMNGLSLQVQEAFRRDPRIPTPSTAGILDPAIRCSPLPVRLRG